MAVERNFQERLEAKVKEQLKAQQVGYLLGAGSSFLGGAGYPLSLEIWDEVKDRIVDADTRNEIEAKLDENAGGIEQALDLLDDGRVKEGPHRHLVAQAISSLFEELDPPLDDHIEFVRRLSGRGDPRLRVFSLNYDPLIERAAEHERVRLADGFVGQENAFFEPAVFDERIFQIRGNYKGRQPDETAKPIKLLKLHGSIGWYECQKLGIRRCAFSSAIPEGTKRLMIPPQRRKANDTMTSPYSALWSTFRGALGQDSTPLNRLACIGYGFADEHVNVIIEGALTRSNFTVLIFTKELPGHAWDRWSTKDNVIVVTKERCSINGEAGEGHCDLWDFQKIAKEV